MCSRHVIVQRILESMGLKMKLPRTLEMDNKGAPVDPANNWSIGVHTRHVDVRQCFRRELKESKVMSGFGE
jgi:hypothetical protein